MTCKTPCPNCNRKGTPIFFTRYGVAFSAQKKGMEVLRTLAPRGHLQAQPQGVAAGTAAYNVRMLRAGYLYVFINRKGAGSKWEAYAVHPHGYLNPFPVGAPESAQPKAACQLNERQANNSLVWIEDAENVQDIWYFFNPDPIDAQVLVKEISPKLTRYAQRFDVAAWLGGNTSQDHSVSPSQIGTQVVEFAALLNEAVVEACDGLLFGLMGSSAKERSWGDYETDITQPVYNVRTGLPTGRTNTVTHRHRQPAYRDAHGERLLLLGQFLANNKGAILACHDAIGIAQELGHLQAEAHTVYAAWQARSAEGFHPSVNNEWVYQAALGAKSLRELVKVGAVTRTEANIAEMEERTKRMPMYIFRDEATRQEQLAIQAKKRAEAIERMRNEAQEVGERQFSELFNQAAADRMLGTGQVAGLQQQQLQQALALRNAVCTDQVRWLDSAAIQVAMDRYSRMEDRIGAAGGGGALSVQLFQALAGTESNEVGVAWLSKADLLSDGVLGRAIAYNCTNYKQQLKAYWDSVQAPAALPSADQTLQWADQVTRILKTGVGYFAVGDKADGAIAAMRKPSVAFQMFADSWESVFTSLMSVKLVRAVGSLPTPQLEQMLTRYTLLHSIRLLGSAAPDFAAGMAAAERDRLRNANRAIDKAALRAPVGSTAKAARAAAVGAFFDTAFAIIKGAQLGVKPDGRTGVEMIGNVLQAVGSIADWRAKIYEETVYAGVRAHDFFTKPGMQTAFDQLRASHLRALRFSAIKFLLPAALISAFFDGLDAFKSIQRRDFALAMAQAASAVSAGLAIAGTTMTAVAGAGSTALGVAAVLSLVGAVLAVASVVAIWALSDEEWENWLKDNPLRKGLGREEPVHENLKETLQELANARSELQAT